jgi:hypothetical protein
MIVRPKGHPDVSVATTRRSGQSRRAALVAALAWLGIGTTQAFRTGSIGWIVPSALGFVFLIVFAGFIGRAAYLANVSLELDVDALTYRDFRGHTHTVPLTAVHELKRLAVEIQPGSSIFFHYLVWLDASGEVRLRIAAPGWPLRDVADLISDRDVRFDAGTEEQLTLAQAAKRYPGLFSWKVVHWRILVVAAALLIGGAVTALSVAR